MGHEVYARKWFTGEYYFIDTYNVKVDCGMTIVATQVKPQQVWQVHVQSVGRVTLVEDCFVEDRSLVADLEKAIEQAVFQLLFNKKAQHPHKKECATRGRWR